jgi:uncharacterized protein (DUF433 family)
MNAAIESNPSLLMSTLPQGLEQKIEEVLSRIERLESAQVELGAPEWRFLVERPHPWRRQLCIKGRNTTAAQLVATLESNGLTEMEAADDFGLPIEAIHEAVRYCRDQASLLALEANEERRRLVEKGYRLEPPPLS